MAKCGDITSPHPASAPSPIILALLFLVGPSLLTIEHMETLISPHLPLAPLTDGKCGCGLVLTIGSRDLIKKLQARQLNGRLTSYMSSPT